MSLHLIFASTKIIYCGVYQGILWSRKGNEKIMLRFRFSRDVRKTRASKLVRFSHETRNSNFSRNEKLSFLPCSYVFDCFFAKKNIITENLAPSWAISCKVYNLLDFPELRSKSCATCRLTIHFLHVNTHSRDFIALPDCFYYRWMPRQAFSSSEILITNLLDTHYLYGQTMITLATQELHLFLAHFIP